MTRRPAVLLVVFLAVIAPGCRRGTGSVPPPVPAEAPEHAPVQVAPGVWFQRYTYDFGSNVAWAELDGGVVVYDTAFPKGAEAAIDTIRRTTGGKPIRHVVVSHYHYDHAFGAGVFARLDPAPVIIAHENARAHHLLRNPAQYAAWAADPKQDARYRRHRLPAPTATFRDRMTLGTGARRIELLHFGHGHTTGDAFLWIPGDGVLMTGDACNNGPHNYMWDSDTARWIAVLEKAAALDPRVVLPGHGPHGGREVLEQQRQYFADLRVAVGAHVTAGHDLARARAEVTMPAWQRWGVGRSTFMLTHVEHVFRELSGHRRGNEPSLGIVDPKLTAWPDAALR